MTEELTNSWKPIEESKPMEDKKPDMVNHPPHYTKGGIEAIDIIKAKLGVDYKHYAKGTIMAYALRLGDKDSWEQDAGKIEWYARDLKEFAKENGQ